MTAKCEYCGNKGKIVQDKKYCEKCQDKMVQECVRCRKPFHSFSYFSSDENHLRCNSCQNKYLKEKIKNKGERSKKVKSKENISESESSSSEESEEEIVKKAASREKKKNINSLPKSRKRKTMTEDELSEKEETGDSPVVKNQKKTVKISAAKPKKKMSKKADIFLPSNEIPAGAKVNYMKLPDGYVAVYSSI